MAAIVGSVGGPSAFLHLLAVTPPINTLQIMSLRLLFNLMRMSRQNQDDFFVLEGYAMLEHYLCSKRCVLNMQFHRAILYQACSSTSGSTPWQDPFFTANSAAAAAASRSPRGGDSSSPTAAGTASFTASALSADSPLASSGPASATPSAVIGLGMLPPQPSATSTATGPLGTSAVQDVFITNVPMLRHVLLNFRVWHRAPISCHAAVLSDLSDLVDRARCRYSTFNAMQLRRAGAMDLLLNVWQEDNEVMSKSIAEYLIRVLRLLIRESAHLDDDAMRDGCQVRQQIICRFVCLWVLGMWGR